MRHYRSWLKVVLAFQILTGAHLRRDFTQDKVSPGDGVQIMPYPGLPSPPSSPSDPHLGILRPHYSKDSGKRSQEVRPPSGKGGPPDNTVVHAEASVVESALKYAEDPLFEFYAQARSERDAEVC